MGSREFTVSETEYVDVWQCIGCGKMEAPQPCIGVCKDRKTRYVHASTYDAVLARLACLQREHDEALGLLQRLAHTKPRDGRWEATYRALQVRAQNLLSEQHESAAVQIG